MKVHNDIDALPAFRNAVVTIGTFDGVHLGHRKIISRMKEVAAEEGGETVIITFHPHPRKVVSSTILGLRLLLTMDEKINMLRSAGIDHLVIVPFTDAFAHQTALDYLENFLIGKFHPHTIIIGYDHRFGRDRGGDFRLLETMSARYQYKLLEIPKEVLNEIAVSSTKIREALLHADPHTARQLLGYPFFFSGEVVHGDKLGRSLGYPTANLRVKDEEKIIPGDGIYTVWAITDEGEKFGGMMSIGFRPTVDGRKRVIEVHLFEFNKDIYGSTLQVEVLRYLRQEEKFDTLDDLKKKMDEDMGRSLRILEAEK